VGPPSAFHETSSMRLLTTGKHDSKEKKNVTSNTYCESFQTYPHNRFLIATLIRERRQQAITKLSGAYVFSDSVGGKM